MQQLLLTPRPEPLESALARVEGNDHDWIKAQRIRARELCRQNGQVCADDLRVYASIAQLGSPLSSKAWGGIFTRNEWVCIGRKRSEYPGNNGRYIVIWRLRAMGEVHHG